MMSGNFYITREVKMISNVVQRGGWYWIYDENGKKTGQVTAGDGLVTFTSTTVSVKHGNQIWIFDEKGHQTGSCPAR
jgi:hypothetical protein